MISRDSAIEDDNWHLNGCSRVIGPRGGVTITIKNVRRNGRTKVWVTLPEHFSLPVKYGMYEAFRIDQWDAVRFHSLADCPLKEDCP